MEIEIPDTFARLKITMPAEQYSEAATDLEEFRASLAAIGGYMPPNKDNPDTCAWVITPNYACLAETNWKTYLSDLFDQNPEWKVEFR